LAPGLRKSMDASRLSPNYAAMLELSKGWETLASIGGTKWT
jgi:hypothetical protein